MTESKIPVRNIFYMLCYAFDCLEMKNEVPVGTASYQDSENTLGWILGLLLNRVSRDGLYREYRDTAEIGQAVRGKIDFAKSVKLNLFSNGSAAYEFSELSIDNVPNQRIKRAIRALLHSGSLNNAIAMSLQKYLYYFATVQDFSFSSKIEVSSRRLRIPFGYKMILALCEFIENNVSPETYSGDVSFPDLFREKRSMAVVFERFVKNFYDREQSHFFVSAEHLERLVHAKNPLQQSFIPIMRTDVILASTRRVIVVDAKYYEEPLVFGRFGNETVRSGHLYQMAAYLTAKRRMVGHNHVEGILLYPVIDKNISIDTEFEGMRLTVATVDLTAPWEEVHAELLSMVGA